MFYINILYFFKGTYYNNNLLIENICQLYFILEIC
jgi:hypothetical protein